MSTRTWVLSCVVALSACGGGSPTDAGIAPEIVGRLERGNTIQVVVRDASGTAVAPSGGVTITPSAAGVVTGNSIQLTQSGGATISAVANGHAGTVAVTIAVPPTIYFDAVDQGNRDIYSATLDGQELHRWTTNPFDDQEPTVAKGQLVFSSSRSGSFDLFLITLGTGAERQLTSASTNEMQPSLSNDGARLVYTSDVTGSARLFLAASDATSGAMVTSSAFNSGATVEVGGRFSPLGDRLVFGATPTGRTNLFITASTAGSSPAAVAGSNSQATDVEPAWSPDGARVVFASTRGGGTSLYTVNVQSGAVTALPSTDSSGQPTWLADGRVVFTRFSGTGSSLAWMDPDAPNAVVHAIALPYTGAQHATGAR